jgi:hypothetical protein
MGQTECSEMLAYKIKMPGELPRRKHTTWERFISMLGDVFESNHIVAKYELHLTLQWLVVKFLWPIELYLSDILCIWGVKISHFVQYARHQELVFRSCRRQENLSHLHIVHASSGAYPASCPIGNGGSFPWGKCLGRKTDHSPLSSVDVMYVEPYLFSAISLDGMVLN